MEYYDVNDVMRITGCEISKAYEIIRELNKKFKKKYPDSVPILGKIVKWYFDEAMGIKKDCQESP